MKNDLSDLCDYGCEKQAKYKLKNGKYCCSKNANQCSEQRLKNSKGLKKAYSEGRKQTPFTFDDRIKAGNVKYRKWIKENINTTLCENSTASNDTVKRLLVKLNLMSIVCKVCGTKNWQGKPIVLELDHINGINNDNRLHNLRLLCPNCHSQTETFRGRGINKGTIIISDIDFKQALENNKSIRQALLSLGLAPKGGNYIRAKRLMAQ